MTRLSGRRAAGVLAALDGGTDAVTPIDTGANQAGRPITVGNYPVAAAITP